MARADIHVFGSRSGYETLAASPRLSEDEIRSLAIFQFGEAATSEAIARLESVAVMSGRPLASGRFAISRMLPAGTDDAGRPTIEVVSLVLDAAGYEACAGSLSMLAEDVNFWRRARATVATGIEIPRSPAVPGKPSDAVLLRVYDLWFAALRDDAIGVLRESESATVLEFVCTLDPRDRAKCCWGIGLLSISTPADIASIASGTSTRGARKVIRPAQEGSRLCEKMDYVEFRAQSAARCFVASDELLLAAHVPAEFGGFAQGPRTVRVSVHSKDARAKSVTLVAIGSALLSTLVMALGVSAYAGMWKHPVQVMPPIPSGSGGVGAHEEVAPGNRSSKYAGNKQNTTAPVPETSPAESTPTPPPVEPPVEPPPAAPEIDPSMVDRDGDGKVGAEDECPDERTLTKQIEYFPDTDADGKGDPNARVKSCSTKPTPGYVTNGDDQCPTNPKKIAEGECGCLCDFDGVDADDDGQSDCLQKGSQGNFNRDTPGWKPDTEGAESIKALSTGLTTIAKGVAEIRRELESSAPLPLPKLEVYKSLLTNQLQKLNALGNDLFQLQKVQFDRSKDPQLKGSARGFAQRLWPAVIVKGTTPVPKIATQWQLIVGDLEFITDAIEEKRAQFMHIAGDFSEGGTGSKSDRTRGDVERSVDRCFNDAKDALKGTSKVLLNRQKLENELTGLEDEPEASP